MSIFDTVKMSPPKTNTFDLSHDKKLSMGMGKLYPILCEEILPGDVFNVTSQQMVRMAPMLAPIMHRVDVTTHFFYVPNRMVWSNWEIFITGGEGGDENPVAPYLNLESCHKKTIADYMGVPLSDPMVGFTDPLKVSALPFAAYSLIWNEYYRDQNQQAKKPYKLIDGAQPVEIGEQYSAAGTTCYNRAWEKDYFTSALPWPQKGPQATIPLGTTAPLTFKTSGLTGDHVLETDGTPANGALTADGDGILVDGDGTDSTINNSANLLVDLSAASAATINSLRNAYALQRWLEKNARAGSRYTESLIAHFNVHNDDLRLNRPQYLGGGKTNISISEVLQMSATDTESPQGNMSGHGISLGSSHAFSQRFKEHGYVIGLMSILPKPAYQDGLQKKFFRFDKLDYAWPDFAHLGEQQIQNQELYIDQDGEVRDDTWGYTPRYAEYKYSPSTVHADFRDQLDFWHMGRKFADQPYLNEEFIECNPTKRIFAVTDTDVDAIWCHVFNRVKARRPLPYFGTPMP